MHSPSPRKRRGSRLALAFAVITAYAFAAAASAFAAASDDAGDDSNSAETASKSAKRHRRVTRPKAQPWSGSVSLALGSCLRQAAVTSIDPDLDQIPCSPDLDTAAADHTGGIAVGLDADAAYAATRRLTLSLDGFYEPVGHSLFTTMLGAYEMPFRKDAALVHELSIGMPFAPGNRPADPTAVTVTESLQLTPPKWLIDTGVFADVYLGDEAPVAGHGAEAALKLSPFGRGPFPAPRGISPTESHLGVEFQGEGDLNKRWALGASFIATIRVDSGASGATLIEGSPIEVIYRVGHWMDDFEVNVATENVGGPASVGVELTTRYDF